MTSSRFRGKGPEVAKTAGQTDGRQRPGVYRPAVMIRWPARRSLLSIGPVPTAVLLALGSIPLVAWSLQLVPPAWVLANEGWVTAPIEWRPMGWAAAIILAACAALPAALLAGYAGGLIWRLNRTAGLFTTLTLAWLTGIVMLPIAASVLDIPLRTGISCFFGCEANLRDDQPQSGAIAYAQLVLGSIPFLPGLLVPGVVLVIARRLRSLAFAFVGVVLAHGLVHVWAITQPTSGALIPYLCLVVGLAVWAYWLQLREAALAYVAA